MKRMGGHPTAPSYPGCPIRRHLVGIPSLLTCSKLLSSLPIETYDLAVVRVHAPGGRGRSKGWPRAAYDLMIAATAAAAKRILLTADAKAGFDQLNGVLSKVLSPC
jgi:predicted nucleic acid-binding protein